ncbi:hypothetical protein HKBW3S44_01265 [Candidatus Hakubella thermalkaliphila]|uniref:Uncharacterized protein n=1 Tax=Candidatus Hakubella thermalkaliphila TaxID=2754717 RepID=A0A6V8Q9K4_9ACTN|nr:hypothetical protein HKBW3S44_01265 [Candidatus Hakubella thermalkaliphila]GFP41070.1 hypothetical protein HKBW3C_00196 [Candidatus Hakubella thermalkaliphila]
MRAPGNFQLQIRTSGYFNGGMETLAWPYLADPEKEIFLIRGEGEILVSDGIICPVHSSCRNSFPLVFADSHIVVRGIGLKEANSQISRSINFLLGSRSWNCGWW